MDAVFDAQFRNMMYAFGERGIHVEIAYRPDGGVDYLYQAGRLLTIHDAENDRLLREILPGIRRVERDRQPEPGELVVMSIDQLREGFRTVPQALALIDERLGGDNPALSPGGQPIASPDHFMHITRLCPAVEPEVPAGNPTQPWPPLYPPGPVQRDVLIHVCDTGYLAGIDPATYPWLAGVTGELDQLGPILPNGQPLIPEYKGHGTFVAGVARSVAPQATIYVTDHFTTSGAELESVIVAKLESLAASSPDIINLSAGTYTRQNWTSLGFETFNQRHPDITLVAAAGNDGTDRPFYPAAYDWTVSVGAIAIDLQHRAWFSNYGPWVDVYAPGEGMVNAYATGEYVYQEPPRQPATQQFSGMARWDGTSFSTPFVAGLIAARMARTGESSAVAAAAVIAAAQAQVITGIGPALLPGDQP